MKKLLSLLLCCLVVALPLDASTIKILYGTSNQTVTITLASLATGAYRQSTVVDNSSTLCLDAEVTVNIQTAAASVSATGSVNVYAYGTTDGGTTYDGGASGTDGSYSVDVAAGTTPNISLIGVLTANGNSLTLHREFSVAQGFNNNLPQKWGIIVQNLTAQSFSSAVSPTANFVQFQCFQNQSQ